MTQCHSVNVKSSNSQLDKLKSAAKNAEKVVLRLSPNIVGNNMDETNFPQKLFELIDKSKIILRLLCIILLLL